MRIPRHLPVIVVITAWIVFVVSFFLPTTDVLEMPGTPPGTPLTGWQAFTTSFEMIGYPLSILLIAKDPRILVLLTFPLINFVMLFSPLAALAWEEAWTLSGWFMLCGSVPWLLPKEIAGHLFVGFYLWDFSFFMMSAGCILASIAHKQADVAELQRLRKTVA